MVRMSFKQQQEYLQDAVHAVTQESFVSLALDVFRFQAKFNPIYSEYLRLLNVNTTEVSNIYDIPALPIQFFKSHIIKTGDWLNKMTFTSSGTSGDKTSRHFVREPEFYLKNCEINWNENYGKVKDYCVLALLPSYLEREGSSLILMAEDFIKKSKYKQSGFFLYDTERLLKTIKECQEKNIPTVLLGVTFALLDLAEKEAIDLSNIIVMETGGMKGRRKEITRKEMHQFLCKSFNISDIHSEYGMTELFSQAYSKGGGIFHSSSTLRLYTREITDPFTRQNHGKTGAINLIDLANFNTCSFIATDDLGKTYEDGSFEILGRLDASDIRGCNLLIL
jgi:hypothetical protein